MMDADSHQHAAAAPMSWLSRSARTITLWVLLLAAVLFVLLISLIVTLAHRSLERELVNSNTSVAGLVQQVVSEHLSAFSNAAELMAQRSELLLALDARDTILIRQQLRRLVQNHPDNNRAFIADVDGVLRYDYPEDPDVLNQDFSHRDWYGGVSTTQAPYLSLIYQRAALEAPYVVAVAVPIREENGVLKGYLVCQRTVEGLAEWLSRYSPEPGGSIRLFDRAGSAARIHAEQPSRQWVDHPLVRQALDGHSGTRRAINPETGARSLISYAPVEPVRWAVVVSRPWDETVAPATYLTRNIIGFAVVALLILAALGYFWLRILFQYQRSLLATNDAINHYVAKLQAANQELESFSYTVSHDLRAPLRAMDGFSRILEEEHGVALPEQARRYLRLVRENALQMGRLIDDLLAFSRLNRHELKQRTVDPDEIVDQVLAELVSEEDGNAEIRRSHLPPCEADPSLLKQVFGNLIGNALKYSRKHEHPIIEIGAGIEDTEVLYYVKDNGVGFDMAYADKLFGVFQRLHRAEDFPGTGVGLAIVQRIVHRHGGRVWAEAEPDRGATFYFTLDQASNHERRTHTHPAGGRQPE